MKLLVAAVVVLVALAADAPVHTQTLDIDALRARAEQGDGVGVHEALAGSALGSTKSHGSRLTVAEASAALRIDSDDLFDLLGQRPELLQQIFSALFSKQGLETAETSRTGVDDA